MLVRFAIGSKVAAGIIIIISYSHLKSYRTAMMPLRSRFKVAMSEGDTDLLVSSRFNTAVSKLMNGLND